MSISENYDQPTIKFYAFETIDGAPLKEPLILVDYDSLPVGHRIYQGQPVSVEVNGWALAGQSSTFTGPWRACVPGRPIVVEAEVSCEYGNVLVESSNDGSAVVDSVCPGNIGTRTRTGLLFTTSLPFYRVAVAPSSSRAELVLRSQQRTA